jgi:hypothetical protein
MKMKNGKNVPLPFFFFFFFLRNHRLVDQSALVYPSEAGGTCASKCFPTDLQIFQTPPILRHLKPQQYFQILAPNLIRSRFGNINSTFSTFSTTYKPRPLTRNSSLLYHTFSSSIPNVLVYKYQNFTSPNCDNINITSTTKVSLSINQMEFISYKIELCK